MAIYKCLQAFLLVSLVASASAAGSQPDSLLNEAKNFLGTASANVQEALYDLVDGLFGPKNTFYTQIPSDIEKLSWDSIQNIGFSNPVSDFIDSIKNKTLAHDILEAEDKVTDFIDQFCTGASLEDAAKIPSNCVGKQMVVKLAPWSCSLYDNKTVACHPPYIEIIRHPAVCTAKHERAAVFEGKQCRLRKVIGQGFHRTIGGNAFSIDISKNLLTIPQQVAGSLLPGVFDSSSAFTAASIPQVTTAGRR